MIKAVFFDLDGTLLPFDRKTFEKNYFKVIACALKDSPNCQLIVKTVMESVEAMTRNESNLTNEQVFIDYFTSKVNDKPFNDYEMLFNQMYLNEFTKLKAICGFEPKAKQMVDLVKTKGILTICATNPLFPLICTKQRIEWAGLSMEDFDMVTTYENSVSAKPNAYYFKWLLNHLNLKPEEVILVGNDAIEDGAALSLGIQVVLIDRCLENKEAVTEHMKVDSIDNVITYLESVLG